MNEDVCTGLNAHRSAGNKAGGDVGRVVVELKRRFHGEVDGYFEAILACLYM